MTSTKTASAAPARCDCSKGGSWGATGVMPVGHHMHFTKTGFYLAHGAPSPSDYARLADHIDSEFQRAVEVAWERRDEKMRALDATAEVTA